VEDGPARILVAHALNERVDRGVFGRAAGNKERARAMPRIVNRTNRPVKLITGLEVPAEGDIHASFATLDRLEKDDAYFRMMLRKGSLEVESDPEVAQAEPEESQPLDLTRSSLSSMKKADLIDLLESHGVELSGGEKADELRGMAEQVIFVNT